MRVRTKEVREIAWLARLAIDDAAVVGYAGDLADILTLVEQMQAVDTSALAPLAHPLELSTPLRPDGVTEENQRDDFQQQAPLTQDGYYLVPRFVE